VRSIKQITRAMEMVAAAKLRRSQRTLRAGRPYADKLQELLTHLGAGSDLGEHPLFQPREGRRKIMVLFSADRGLCGSFNTNLIKMAEETLKAEPQTQWELVTVGRRGRDYFQKRGWTIVEEVTTLKGQPDSAEARRLAGSLLERYETNQCDSIELLYPAFISTVLSRPIRAPYLPLGAETVAAADPAPGESAAEMNLEYIFDPSSDHVFNSLLPRYLSSKLYITMAEAATAEHSARMVAMNNATRNCTDLGDELTLKLNQARQATITTELLDIVGGAEAVTG
jgi:F-type H+-transporting ATPase subunit gamma